MNTPATKPLANRLPSFWGLVSLGLPISYLVLGYLVCCFAKNSDNPDISSLSFIIFMFALMGGGLVGLFGAAAAIRAIMKKEKWIAMPLVGLLPNLAWITIGCCVGYSILPKIRLTEAAPEQLAPTPMLAKVDAAPKEIAPSIIAQPIASPAPKPDAAPVAESQPKADPQTDLKTVIPDLVRLVRAGDNLRMVQTYTPPEIWAKIGPEYTQQFQKIVQPKLDAANRDPEMERRWRMISEPAAGSYEALEKQTPTFNANGDEATYIFTLPEATDLVNGTYTGTSTGPKIPLVFVKINGKWYFKQPPEIPQERPM